MIRKLTAYWRDSVNLRFTFLTFFLILFLNLNFIIIDGYFSIRKEQQRLTDQITQIEQSHTPAIIYGLWLTDEELVKSQIETVVLFPYIEYVEVIDEDGRIFRAGKKNKGSLSVHSQDLSYSRRGSEFPVGRMNIYFDEKKIRSAVLKMELIHGVAHFLNTLIAAGAVAFLFNRMVGTHLRQLARYATHSKDPGSLEFFRLKRSQKYNDELQSLVEAVNEMRQSLTGYINEREILMKEIHHRVKNDLSFVISLLSLQAHSTSSPEVQKALEEAGRRLNVMSNIYRQIYSSEDFREIEVSTVIGNVVTDFKKNGLLLQESVDLSFEPVVVPQKVSIALGIILNELLTNSLKYSSRAPKELKLQISLSAHAPQSATPPASQRASQPSSHPITHKNYAEIVMSDNGKGFPEQVLKEEHVGYGLTIVKALVEQHNGSFALSNDNGAHVEIVI